MMYVPANEKAVSLNVHRYSAADVYEPDAETLANCRERGIVVPVAVAPAAAPHQRVTVRLPGLGGGCTSQTQVTRSLKPPGCNP
jgi:hypothetical protein